MKKKEEEEEAPAFSPEVLAPAALKSTGRTRLEIGRKKKLIGDGRLERDGRRSSGCSLWVCDLKEGENREGGAA